jgi:hypothetical protein
MRRLFTFGCSYTSYSWPTWSNLISVDFEEYHNWALSGLGNRAIAERISEANVRYQFTSDDVVIVQWSSHLRNDFWHMYSLPDRKTNWKTSGSIFNYINEPLYDKKWINTFFFEPAYFMHTLNYISLTQGLLKSLGVTWYMTSIGDIRNMGADLRDNTGIGEKTDLVSPADAHVDKVAWKKIPDLEIYNKTIWEDHKDNWLSPLELIAASTPELTFTFLDTTNDNTVYADTHPSSRQHMLWVMQELADKLQLSDNTIETMNLISNAVDDAHEKFRFNKQLFELTLAKRVGFPDNIYWPTKFEGF